MEELSRRILNGEDIPQALLLKLAAATLQLPPDIKSLFERNSINAEEAHELLSYLVPDSFDSPQWVKDLACFCPKCCEVGLTTLCRCEHVFCSKCAHICELCEKKHCCRCKIFCQYCRKYVCEQCWSSDSCCYTCSRKY